MSGMINIFLDRIKPTILQWPKILFDGHLTNSSHFCHSCFNFIFNNCGDTSLLYLKRLKINPGEIE